MIVFIYVITILMLYISYVCVKQECRSLRMHLDNQQRINIELEKIISKK